MNTVLILDFLKALKRNNNREWFYANKKLYEAARADFTRGVAQAIEQIQVFDPDIQGITPKDSIYRINRDIRFSLDKSPYKDHFGAYICRGGRSSMQGGYYIHLQPGNCFIATGAYCLPTNILTSCRNEIMGNIDTWRKAVENKDFVKLFGRPNDGHMGDFTDENEMSENGFGINHLKKAPKGFPADYEFAEYLKMKDYCCWQRVSDDYFEGDGWLKPTMHTFKTAKPMQDIINSVVEDYE